MEFIKEIKKYCRFKSLTFMFFLSFLLWVFIFRKFLFGSLTSIPCAHPYYDHIKFYLTNMMRGIYPMWEPFGGNGFPNDLFLSRIGAFNPFYLLIILFNGVGLSFALSYRIFLMIYYFIGMIGFYLIAKRIFNDTKMAFVSYLLLAFSSLAIKLFYDFIILVFVPMIWFFFFFVAFTSEQKRHFLLGAVFALMIIVTTYIPFYFLTVFLSFLICFCAIYFRDTKAILLRYFEFLRKNKIFICLCIFVLLVSLIPGIMFFQDSSRGEFELPIRHLDSSIKNALQIDVRKVTAPGTSAYIQSDRLFTDLKKTNLSSFYVPVFVYLLLLLGIIATINKRLILLLIWGFIIFLVSSPETIPIHRFLYKHIFYFKYFRNLGFFLHLSILPILILFAVEQFRVLLNYCPNTKREKRVTLIFILIAHFVFIAFLYSQGNIVASSYWVVVVSLLFFIFYFLGDFGEAKLTIKERLKFSNPLFLFFILIVIAIQPIEVFHYFNKNSEPWGAYTYNDETYLNFSFTNGSEKNFLGILEQANEGASPGKIDSRPVSLYITTAWNNFLFKNLNKYIYSAYTWHKFVVYDHVEWVNDDDLDIERIGQAFLERHNVAFVSPTPKSQQYSREEPKSRVDDLRDNVKKKLKNRKTQSQFIKKNSEEFKILGFNVNSIKIKTNFDSRKFLVYHDAFYTGWSAFINGKETDILRANVAFKGLWLPAGENIVYLRYREKWRYVLSFFILGIFYAVFAYLLWMFIKPYHHLRNNNISRGLDA